LCVERQKGTKGNGSIMQYWSRKILYNIMKVSHMNSEKTVFESLSAFIKYSCTYKNKCPKNQGEVQRT
jgi:hypothetical protein